MIQINIKKGEHLDKALRRLKKVMVREGVFQEVKNHRYYEKPSFRNRRKMKMARFNAMLRERYADT
jgi:small subunit ribosomal protein S21